MKDPVVTVNARPEPLTIDLGRTAVIVIDMQNDFGAKGGLFDLAGMDISAIQEAVAPIAGVIAGAREAGLKIVYVKMEHRPDLSDTGGESSSYFVKLLRGRIGQRVVTPDGRESRVQIKDTWNTDILDDLKPLPDDIVISKHRNSAFFGTDLDMILRSLGIKFLIVTGCATSVCVDSTIRDAMFRDYWCLLLSDCTADASGSDLAGADQNATLRLIAGVFGWVSDSGTFLEALKG